MPCDTITNFSSNIKNLTLMASDPEHRRLIRHLYRRMGYGASLTDINYADGKTINGLVNNLIDTASSLSLTGDFDWLNRLITIPDRTSGNGDIPIPIATYNDMIVSHWVNESITEGVRSKLMLFWHNHFVTGETTHDKHYAMLRYFKLLHDQSFGDFKQFTVDMGRTPRMLKYLNGNENTVIRTSANGVFPLTYTNPNENYARELLELFTMGIEDKYGSLPTSLGGINYSAEDINQIAKAFTGWKVAQNGPTLGNEMPSLNPEQFRFKYGNHDWSQKGFLRDPNPVTPYPNSYDYDPLVEYWEEHTGINTAPGNNGQIDKAIPDGSGTPEQKRVKAGDEEYQKVHDLIFERRADQIAYFICEKLYKFYVYADLDAENLQELTTPPSPGVKNIHTYIKELADKFKMSVAQGGWNWNITELLKAIFKSQHFYDAGIIGGQIKSHLESAVSFFRIAGLEPSTWVVDGSGSKISNEDSMSEPDYDYKYRLALLEPHMTNAVTGEGANASDVYDGLYRSHQNSHPFKIAAACAEIGQALLNPPNVAGWSGHHYWLNEFTLIKRRAILEYYLGSESFGDGYALPESGVTLTGYYDAKHGFRMVTKKKFLKLAKDLIDLEYPSGTNPNPAYTDSCKVIRVMWRHFLCVEPTPQQEIEALKLYCDDDTITTDCTYSGHCQTPDVGADTVEMANLINNLLLHFIRQPEYHLT